MADLYQVTPQAIAQHIRAVYEEGELDQNSTCKDYLQVQMGGVMTEMSWLGLAQSVKKRQTQKPLPNMNALPSIVGG